MDGARPTALRQSARNVPHGNVSRIKLRGGRVEIRRDGEKPFCLSLDGTCPSIHFAKKGGGEEERGGWRKNRLVVIGVARSSLSIVRRERRLRAFLALRSRPFQSAPTFVYPSFTALCAAHAKISQTLSHLWIFKVDAFNVVSHTRKSKRLLRKGEKERQRG